MGSLYSYADNSTWAIVNNETYLEILDRFEKDLLSEYLSSPGTMRIVKSEYVPRGSIYTVRPTCFTVPLTENFQYRMMWEPWPIPVRPATPFLFWPVLSEGAAPAQEQSRRLEMWVGFVVLFVVMVLLVWWGIR